MRQKPPPIAKINRPVLSGCFPRKRLFRLLDDCRKRKVAWVSGPPGSGKTTLVGSYLDTRDLPCIWYQVDEGDADVATFFYYMGLAAQRAAPRNRRPLPLLAPENIPGIAEFTRRYFEGLYARLRPGSVLVFDNCQQVPAGSLFHEVIRDGLSCLPEGVSAILLSRSDPPPVFARLRAHRQLEVIGWKELRLSPAEAEGIARLRWKGKQRAETVRNLHRRTDGWAAGLVLLLAKPGTQVGDPLKLSTHAPEEIFDYFACEVLEKAAPDIREFLLASAYLPRMTARMAERLTGQKRAGEILSFLSRHNYFTQKHQLAEPVYEYHSLFREFLLSYAAIAFPQEAVPRIRRAAAEILEDSGQAEDAVAFLRESSDWEGLARMIRKHASALLGQGRNQTLGEWLNIMPIESIGSDPWMLYWLGACRLPSHPGESRKRFEESFRIFRERRDAAGVFLSFAGAGEAIMYGYEGLKPLDGWFSDLDALLSDFPEFPSEEIEARLTCSVIRALSLRRPPSVSDMEAWAKRALAIARKTGEISVKTDALVNLACYHYGGGELQQLEIVIDLLRELLQRQDVSPLARLTVSWVEAAHANLASKYDSCRKAVSEGLELAEASGIHVMDYLLMGQGALCSLKSGDPAGAKKFLKKMASSLGTAKPWEASFYHYAAGWEAMRRGDLAQASLHSKQGLKLCENVGNPWTLHLAHLQRAFLFHEFGEDYSAARHLSRARRIGLRSRNDYTEFACLLAEAFFFIRKGEEDSAREALRKGMKLGREKGYVNLYMWGPGVMESVVAAALEAGIEGRYAQDLIRRNGLVPDDARLDVENWPWPLKVYTLGRFAVVKEGKPLQFSRKVRQKPLMMIKALIALGGKEVIEGQMTDVLWPEADGDLAHQSFATTLYRLRNLVGSEKAIPLREGRLTLDNRYCWVDAWAFERMFAKAENAWRDGTRGAGRENALRLSEKSIALYEGSFLAGEAASSWILPLRERLRSKFQRCVGELGRHWEGAGQWEKAANCYRKGLEVDDTAEEFYRRLMACLIRLGRGSEAIAVYERCRKILSNYLGAAPSPETEAVFRSLRPAPSASSDR
jgi:ATP/maltotriose-dependent transcriptional regulator MalT/DNA-binding SARP family transcriptional activator